MDRNQILTAERVPRKGGRLLSGKTRDRNSGSLTVRVSITRKLRSRLSLPDRRAVLRKGRISMVRSGSYPTRRSGLFLVLCLLLAYYIMTGIIFAEIITVERLRFHIINQKIIFYTQALCMSGQAYMALRSPVS